MLFTLVSPMASEVTPHVAASMHFYNCLDFDVFILGYLAISCLSYVYPQETCIHLIGRFALVQHVCTPSVADWLEPVASGWLRQVSTLVVHEHLILSWFYNQSATHGETTRHTNLFRRVPFLISK